jgi:hypothetical protein
MVGVFDLLTPSDLLAKLRREYERLREAPDNADHAFNFFVTAEHMLDWIYPGHAGKDQRQRLRDSDCLLEVTSHLANGAKHFDRLLQHHQSVTSSARRGGYFSRQYFPMNWFARGYFSEPTLVVELSGNAKAHLGSPITAVALAEKVLDYWMCAENVKKPEAVV